MTFAITKYIYPLKKEIFLSEHLNFILDNPRTDDEIKLVKKFIESDLEEKKSDEPYSVAPILSRFTYTIYHTISTLKKNDTDNQLLNYYEENQTREPLDLLAKTWVIIRMSEVSQFNDLANSKSALFRTMFDKKETEYSKAFKDLASYCHLVSLLANNRGQDYFGESFLLSDEPYQIFLYSPHGYVYSALENYIVFNNSLEYTNRYPDWLYWQDGIIRILEEAKRVDSLLFQDVNKVTQKLSSQKQSPKQKLFHIGWLLKTSDENFSSLELTLLLQVSIIEYLITRNPDHSKFNVEDSISKQFKLKCAVVVHSIKKDYDLAKLNEELTQIYNQRSDLAHGNYRDIDEIKISKSVRLLYVFNKHLLNAFIDDRKLIEYLKDN